MNIFKNDKFFRTPEKKSTQFICKSLNSFYFDLIKSLSHLLSNIDSDVCAHNRISNWANSERSQCNYNEKFHDFINF